MIAPRILRELSWVVHRLHGVVADLERFEQVLTTASRSDRMTGLEAVGQGTERGDSEPGGSEGWAEPIQLTLEEEAQDEVSTA